MVEHPFEENLHNGNKNGEYICGDNLNGNNLDLLNTNKLSCPTKALKKYIQVYTCSVMLIGELNIPVETPYVMMARMEHSCEESFYGNNTKIHFMSHHIWKPFHHACSLDDNQHMDSPHAS